MTLLKDINEYKGNVEKRIKEYEGTSYPDTNRALLECNSLLTSVEVMVKHFELRLKREKILLKNSEEYQVFKTLKAKDEQAFMDTYEISERILDLKAIRNKLRYKREYYEFQLQELKEDD